MRVLFRQRITACASIALCAAFLLAGCSNTPPDKDTLVVLEQADATTFNPIFTTDGISGKVQTLILEPLAQIAQGYRYVPWLATSWESSPNHLRWTVHLRHGVKWSDGAPFTSADVVWTWNALLDPATGFQGLGDYDYLKRVYATDPYTVIFELNRPSALFVSNVLSGSPLPEHLLGKYPHADLRRTDFGEHPIGTGPYILVQWKHDESMTFTRNFHWWHGLSHIKRVVLEDVFTPDVAVEAMKSGDAQIVDRIDSSSLADLEGTPGIRFVRQPFLYAGIVKINHRRPGLNDNRILQAMMYGWDRADDARKFYRGYDTVSTGIIVPALVDWYDPNVRKYPYEPARARAILDAAGYKVGRDGIRSGHGVRLAYTFTISGRRGIDADAASEFQADMHNIGIGITIQIVDFSAFSQKDLTGDFDMLNEMWGGGPDPDRYSLLDSSQVPPIGNNAMHYKDMGVDHDVEEGRLTSDSAKRKALYDDMQRRTAEHLPFLFTFYVYYYAAISSRVQMDDNALLASDIFYNIYDWKLSP